MPNTKIYLDNNSTTALDKRVLKAMMPYLTDHYGNASSISHSFGWQAAEAVNQSRQHISHLIGSKDPESIVFTSGTTESNNLIFKGLFFARKKPLHIISQTTEHKCVVETGRYLESQGCEVTWLGVDSKGFVDLCELKKALRKDTDLVSIMYANNEIGTIQPVQEIAKVIHENSSALFHTDAAQAVGKLPVDVERDGIDFMSFSAHKIHGPKGIGALYLSTKKMRQMIMPLFHGGGHEQGLRSGTLNVPAIVGFAEALHLCLVDLEDETKRLLELRDFFISEITKKIEYTELNGDREKRLPQNINISFESVDAGELMMAMPELAVSSGSACATGAIEPSVVIRALGKDPSKAKSSIRFGLSRFTTKEEVGRAIEVVISAVQKLRKKSLEYEMKHSKEHL